MYGISRWYNWYNLAQHQKQYSKSNITKYVYHEQASSPPPYFLEEGQWDIFVWILEYGAKNLDWFDSIIGHCLILFILI